MATRPDFENDPCYVISIAARMVGVHAQTLRYYERVGLVSPSRSEGKRRLYSPRDIDRLMRIKTLIDEMGINLAGVDVVLRLLQRIVDLETENSRLAEEITRLRLAAASTTGRDRPGQSPGRSPGQS